MTREQFRFSHPLRVRWAEADMQGVVFNAHYMTYCDVGVTEYWRAIAHGDASKLREIFERLYVVKSTLEFRAPAHFDEQIEVRVRTAQMGRSSMRVQFAIERGDQRLIDAESIYVHAQDGASTPIPETLRAMIRDYELTAPQEKA